MSVELHARFIGRVQGVGFRYIVKQLADSIPLVGTVENLPDGSVALIAQGDKEALEQLLNRIEQEFSGYIEESRVEYSPFQKALIDFRIVRKG